MTRHGDGQPDDDPWQGPALCLRPQVDVWERKIPDEARTAEPDRDPICGATRELEHARPERREQDGGRGCARGVELSRDVKVLAAEVATLSRQQGRQDREVLPHVSKRSRVVDPQTLLDHRCVARSDPE